MAVTAILVLVAVLAGVGIGRSLPTSSTSPQAGGSSTPGRASPSTPLGNGASPGTGGGTGPANVSAIAGKIDPDLVDIDTNLSYYGEEAAGTGIVLSPDGLVLTNNHVINQATSIKVTDLATGRAYTGAVVGYDESADVAVVQMEGASGLRTAPLDTAPVKVSEGVVAVGNAGGKGGTPTAAGGTVTALDQSIKATDEGDGTTELLSGLIQTDADVQPGDSGGSLINTSGQVVGMDTAAEQSFSFSTSGAEGYAIPIDTALTLAHEIEAHRASTSVHIGPTAFIGVKAAPQTCTTTGTGPQIRAGSGALVCQIVPGTPAASSSLAANDVIVSLGGARVTSPSVLTHLLVTYHPGNHVTIGYTTASGQHETTTIVLGNGPPG